MNIKTYKELINFSKSFLNSRKPGSKQVIFVRSCENLGALSGSLNGWLDVKLSEYGKKKFKLGRRQAKQLGLEFFLNFPTNSFETIYTSDLKRAKETAELCFAFEKIPMQESPLLRELFFGKNEGIFYDGKFIFPHILGLSKEKKAELGSNKYISPQGESWLDVKYRGAKFLTNFTQEKEGSYVIFTHGGFLSNIFSGFGYQQMQPHGSIFLANVKNNSENSNEKEEISNYLNEYKEKFYINHNKLRSISDEDFHKFNLIFENHIKKQILSLDSVFNMPVLEEEL